MQTLVVNSAITLQSPRVLFPVCKLNVPGGHLWGADAFPGQL